MPYRITPDGRYFVVRGRLWRCANPALPAAERERLVAALMASRRAVGRAQRGGDVPALAAARAAVDEAKRGLGERGPVWWGDGAPDYNQRLVRTTPYAGWFAALAPEHRLTTESSVVERPTRRAGSPDGPLPPRRHLAEAPNVPGARSDGTPGVAPCQPPADPAIPSSSQPSSPT